MDKESLEDLWSILKGGQEAVRGFIEMKRFQAGMYEIQQLAGHSQEQLSEMSQAILNMAQDAGETKVTVLCFECGKPIDGVNERHRTMDVYHEKDHPTTMQLSAHERCIVGSPNEENWRNSHSSGQGGSNHERANTTAIQARRH